MLIVLSAWGKLAAMAIGALFVVLVLLVVVCFVGPGCWGYEWLNEDEERELRRRRLAAASAPSAGDFLKLSSIKSTSGFYTSVGSASSLLGRIENHRDSTYSSMSEATDRSSFMSVATTASSDSNAVPWKPGAEAEAETKDPPPQVQLTLQFVSTEERSSAGKLLIGVKGATGLPAREYVGGLEPYVCVAVQRSTWPLHRRAGPPLHRVRTRVLRHTRHPRFEQTFAVDARRHDIKDWSLRVTTYDHDRYGNPTELCFVDVSLRDIKSLYVGEEAFLSLPMQVSDKEAGELLLGLSFLPTAQRLSVSVVRGSRLRFLEVADSLKRFHPYVRVIQLHGSSGRSVRRKKTSPRPGSDAPDFNEVLTFDLSSSQLESAVFLVLLCSRVDAASASPSPSPPPPPPAPSTADGGDASEVGEEPAPKPPPVLPPRDRCLGKVALGRCVGSRRARQHWLAVMQSPRSVHSAWHALK